MLNEAVGRRSHRQHRPGRRHVVKVSYDDTELTALRVAAASVGLTVSGYVGESAVTAARALPGMVPAPLLGAIRELVALRAAVIDLTAHVTKGPASERGTDPTPMTDHQLVSLLDRLDEIADALTRSIRARTSGHR